MNNFPVISSIDDILPWVDNKTEIVHIVKDGYQILDYVLQTSETFKSSDPGFKWVRECRGIMFDMNGKVISRPFHKFKNLNESEEVSANNLNFSDSFEIMDKLDGSMVRPFPIEVDGKTYIRWATRKGITEVSQHAEVFVAKNPNYLQFAEAMIKEGLTPIFEFISPVRGVVKYNSDNMTLLAIRSIHSGTYVEDKEKYTRKYDIPVVDIFSTPEDIISWIDRTRQENGKEGYVFQFRPSGEMIKVKNDWYVALHKIKSEIENEHEIIAKILNGTLDDIKAALDSERSRVETVENEFWRAIDHKTKFLQEKFHGIRVLSFDDRKNFAINFAKDLKKPEANVMFSLWDGKDCREVLLNLVEKNITRKSLWENFKEWLYDENA